MENEKEKKKQIEEEDDEEEDDEEMMDQDNDYKYKGGVKKKKENLQKQSQQQQQQQLKKENFFIGDEKMYIKPARKEKIFYETDFPTRIHCSPYKYDIFIQIPSEECKNNEIKFLCFDSNSQTIIQFNHKG